MRFAVVALGAEFLERLGNAAACQGGVTHAVAFDLGVGGDFFNSSYRSASGDRSKPNALVRRAVLSSRYL